MPATVGPKGFSCDVLIVGGGPAGLSAAVVLARACRSVIVLDAGHPRNHAAHAMYNFPTRNGVNPRDFLRAARVEAKQFGVRVVAGNVRRAWQIAPGFAVVLADGRKFRSRKLILATGVLDALPPIPGFSKLYGKSVHHCPYCDGWSWRGRRLAAYGVGRDAAGLALLLKGWSEDVVALTEGGPISARVRARLMSHRIQVVHPRVARLRGRGGRLTSIVLANGESLPCDALFFNTGQVQGSPLPASLGCKVGPDGGICVDDRERTCVPGLLVIGDALKQVQFVVTAAAAGADAAVAVCQVLQAEEGRVLGPSRNPR